MFIGHFDISNRVIPALKRVSKKTYIIAGVALVAVPVTAGAYALHQDNTNKTASNVTIQTSAEQAAEQTEPSLSTADAADNVTGEDMNSSSNTMSVNVNGQDIPVPTNGTVNKTFGGSGDGTNVNVNASSVGTTTNDSDSTTSIKIKSSSSSDTNGGKSKTTTKVNISN